MRGWIDADPVAQVGDDAFRRPIRYRPRLSRRRSSAVAQAASAASSRRRRRGGAARRRQAVGAAVRELLAAAEALVVVGPSHGREVLSRRRRFCRSTGEFR